MGKKEEARRLKNQAAISKYLADTSQSEYKQKKWRQIETDLRDRADELNRST